MAGKSTHEIDLPESWRRKAEERCAERGARLTPARISAFAELVAKGQPVSAYELVALLEERQNRKIAPLTVYRHLDFLINVGLVHRIESTQSYVPCSTAEHSHDSQYLLCSECGRADELESSNLAKLLATLAAEHEFIPDSAVIEVKGRCADCAAKDPD